MTTAEGVRRPITVADTLHHGAQMVADRLSLRAHQVRSDVASQVNQARTEFRTGIEDARTIITDSQNPKVPKEERLLKMREAREREREVGGIRGFVARAATFNFEPDLPKPYHEPV
jgi:hypothetical protein